jgi:hypothetical protein
MFQEPEIYVSTEPGTSIFAPYPVDSPELSTEPGLATKCVKVTAAPSARVDVLKTVTRGGTDKETIPLMELVTGMELGTLRVDSGELVIVVNTVNGLDVRTTNRNYELLSKGEVLDLPATLVVVCVGLAGGAGLPPCVFPVELPRVVV